MEIVGVLIFEKSTDSLSPLAFSKSQRLQAAVGKYGFTFERIKIGEISKNKELNQVIYQKKFAITDNINVVWGHDFDNKQLKQANKDSHIQTLILYPLIIEQKSIGCLTFGLNRDYKTLNNFEKDSIKSLVDVVAVALDKSMLYDQLKVANLKLKALDQARSEFITIASHQLRTPPATIKWYLSAILAGDYGQLGNEQKDIIEKTNRTNNSLISLIDDMLNVSRIERGKMEFLFEQTDLLPLVETTYEQLIPQAKEKKLNLIFIPPKTPLPTIMCDKEKIRQVMNNLIDNALKYTKQGSVTIKIHEENGYIKFEVTDTGKGIANVKEAEIFEKFKRGKESVKQSAGLGLGLYVAKIIIEQHKGKIWAESQGEEKGSTFAFSLPIKNDLKKTTLLDLTNT